MKKQTLAALILCLFAGSASAGFSLGRPAAVKKQVSKLDDKVHAKLLAGAAPNRAPVISSFTAVSTSVAAGGLARISVAATDADGDALNYLWTSTTGALSSATGASVYWLAPSTPGVYALNCVVSDGKDTSPGSITLDAVTPGTVKWVFSSASVDVPPALGADGTVYAVDPVAGKLYAISPDGSEKWTTPFSTLGADSFTTNFGPVVGADGNIYVVTDGDKVYAVKPDGNLKWGPSSAVTDAINVPPVIAADGTVYLYDDIADMYMRYPLDGVWVATFTALSKDGPPVIGGDGTIYLKAGPTDTLYAVSPIYGLARTTATLVTGIIWPPAIGSDGTIYWVDGTALHALDPAGVAKSGWADYTPVDAIGVPPVISPDGAIYIRADVTLHRVDTAGNGVAFSDLPGVVVDVDKFAPGPGGAVYAGDNNGEFLYGINPDGTILWGPLQPAGVSNIWTTPVVAADGMVYFNADDGKVYAVYSTSVLP